MAIITTTPQSGIWPDSTIVKPQDVLPEALVLTQATAGTPITGDSPVVRVPFIGADATASIAHEGETIQESNPDLDEMTFRTVKLALIARSSNEALSSDVAAGMISASVQRAVTAKADSLFLNGDPSEPGLIGMLQGGSVMASGTITDNLDGLLDVLGMIGDRGGAPTTLIMAYGSWAKLLKLKAGDGTPLISRSVTEAAAPVLFNLPVVFNSQCPPDTILIHDSAETFASVSPITVATDSSYYFNSDSTAVRCTFRLGFGVIHPERFGVVTIGKPAGGRTGTRTTKTAA